MTRARDVANLIGSGNYSSTTFTATAGQTAFTISHTQGFVQVFMNGLLLDETVDYTSNGSAVTLTSGAAAGDEIEVVAYNTFSVGDAITQTAADTRYVNASGDTMSGDLSVTGADVTITGSTNTDATLNVLSPNWVTGAYADINIAHQPTSRKIRGHYDNGIEIFTNNANAALKVDPSGRVTMPYQPYGQASSSSGTTAVAKIPLNAYTNSRGGLSIDTTNNRMVAPVAGAYLIGYHHLGEAASTQVEMRLNGSLVANSRTQSPNSSSGSNLSITSLVVQILSASDYVEWWCSSGKTHGNPNYNSMFMMLLG